MLQKSSILLFFSFIVCLTVHGQTQFEKGYFVSNDGNRVDCLIRNHKWSDSPKRVVYKLTTEDSEKVWEPGQIRAFGFGEDLLFRSVTAEFPETYIRPNQNDDEPIPEKTQKTVFVKRILRGKTSLYQYRGQNQLIFLFEKDEDGLEVLEYKKYITPIDHKIRENNIFRRQLLQKLSCGTDQDIQRVTYKRKSLIDYVLKYNSCADPLNEEVSKELVRKKIAFNVKMYAGIQQYDFAFDRRGVELDFEDKIVPKFGLEVEGILPFDNNKWGFFLSTDYSSYSSAIDAPNTRTISYDLQMSRLGSQLGGRHYMFLDNRNSLFLDLAVTIDKDFNAQLQEFFENEFFPDITIDVRDLNFGGSVGFGYSNNQKVGLKLNYYFDQTILKGYRTGNELSRLALTFSYRI